MSGLTTVLDGLAMGESPRWHDGRLWVADWGAQQIVALDTDGRAEVILPEVAPLPFSIDWQPDGRLLVICGREGLLKRQEPGGALATIADLKALSPYPWNEIVVDGRGNAYLNTIGFDFPGGDPRPGLVALVTPDGAVHQVADGVLFPNGMVVTPDERTLIVAESYGERLTAFDIDADGGLSRRRTWAKVEGDHPDGICLDAEGAVWYADVGTKRCVRVREGGEVLQTVELDRGAFACMLGGADRRTLFIVAAEWPAVMAGGERTGQVLRIEAPAAGVGWP